MSTSLDEDLTILENLDFDATCDSDTGCSKTAEWSLTRTCCDMLLLFCGQHKTVIADYFNQHVLVNCTGCGTKKIPTDTVTWIKI